MVASLGSLGTKVTGDAQLFLNNQISSADRSTVMYPNSLALAEQYFKHRSMFHRTERLVKRHLVSSALSPLDFCCLCLLAGTNRPLDGVELRRAVELDKSATAKLVARLRAKGFVNTYRDLEDRRHYLLRVSEKGHQFLRALEQLK